MERECGSKELFSKEELQEISGVHVGDDYVEVMCGCTSHRYGDAIARLKIFSDGELQITCQCTPACHEGSSSYLSLLFYMHVSCEYVRLPSSTTLFASSRLWIS